MAELVGERVAHLLLRIADVRRELDDGASLPRRHGPRAPLGHARDPPTLFGVAWTEEHSTDLGEAAPPTTAPS